MTPWVAMMTTSCSCVDVWHRGTSLPFAAAKRSTDGALDRGPQFRASQPAITYPNFPHARKLATLIPGAGGARLPTANCPLLRPSTGYRSRLTH